MAERIRLRRESRTAALVDICLAEGWMMKMYLSTAIRRMEKDEKKTQVDWTLPTSLQMISWRSAKY